MSTNKTHKVTDHMPIVSQFYPGMYTQVVPQQQQGESKARRRRKKNRGGETGVSEIKKRKLTAEQTNLLEQNFGNDQKLESERKDKLALELGLDPRQVAVWFQNKRARWKNKKIEEEYSKLKMAHETAIVEKCHLETEVLKLKEQLSEAEKQIQRRAIAEPTSMVSSNSPSSSLTMTVIDPPFFGEFGMEGYEDALYMPESTYIHNNMEWFNLYM